MTYAIPIKFFAMRQVPEQTTEAATVQYPVNSTGVLNDRLQRPMLDLRISVTDRCNLRCTYCMPGDIFDNTYAFLPRAELLTLDEILRVAKSFIRLGIRKIRLTGGEPLLRRGIEQLIENLAKLRTLNGDQIEIAMTTNGVLLSNKAQALKDAGLSRITVSLDGIDEVTFQRMSGTNGSASSVLEGIAAAQRVGLSPIKVNMVVKRSVNKHEIIPMAEYFRNTGIILRFVEYMDTGSTNAWVRDEVVSAQEVIDLISTHYPVLPIEANCTGEVANRWVYADGAGEIGQIASITETFCHECTRIRLSTDGKLYTCLFAEQSGADLRELLRYGKSDAEITQAIAQCWQGRTDQYSQNRHEALSVSRNKIEMSYIGG